jgi:hypothetical protein
MNNGVKHIPVLELMAAIRNDLLHGKPHLYPAGSLTAIEIVFDEIGLLFRKRPSRVFMDVPSEIVRDDGDASVGEALGEVGRAALGHGEYEQLFGSGRSDVNLPCVFRVVGTTTVIEIVQNAFR